MSSEQQTTNQWRCKPCNRNFSSSVELAQHNTTMRKAGYSKHLFCKFCGVSFKTEAGEIGHIQLCHPQEQHLECPGCGDGPFVRLGGLVHHIERGCPSLNVTMLEELRVKKLDFPRKLESLTNEPIKGDFSRHMQSNTTAQSSGGVLLSSKPDPFLFKKNAFHSWTTSNVGPNAARNEDMTSAEWVLQGKKLEPKVPVAQRPASEQLKSFTQPDPRVAIETLDPHHPGNAGFKVSRYYCKYSGAFVCPRERCGKTFKKSGGLVGHLKSTAHSDVNYTCPYCLDTFKSMTAITQHVESTGRRCRFRETDAYGTYIDQLTAGMVDVSLEGHEDGTVKFQVSKQFQPKK